MEEKVTGRIRSVPVGATAVQVADKNPRRSRITFTVGDANNSSSVMIVDGDDRDATATLGMPLVFGGVLIFTGVMATHRFSAIRLAAVDCVVGVAEEFVEEDGLPTVQPEA